jgi:predicted RNA-binding Zn ribbon-like protein
MQASLAAVDNTGKSNLAGYVPKPNNPSRAGRLHLVAGQLALDFANTASGRGSPTHQEHLHCAEHVLEWARHAAIPAARRLPRGHRGMIGQKAKILFRDAKRLRDIIYEIGYALASSRVPPAALVAQLAARYRRFLQSAELKAGDVRFTWQWRGDEHAVLGPIAQSAIEVLTDLDRARVKQCAGHECGWLFYDATKNNSRRWCDMGVCGNRSKVQAARRRISAQQENPDAKG